MRVQQLSIDAFKCEHDLTDVGRLRGLTEALVAAVRGTVCGSASHEFVPHGITMVVILAESHLVLSTWPEHEYAHVDLVWSGDPLPEEAIERELRRHLGAATLQVNRLIHEVPKLALPLAESRARAFTEEGISEPHEHA